MKKEILKIKVVNYGKGRDFKKEVFIVGIYDTLKEAMVKGNNIINALPYNIKETFHVHPSLGPLKLVSDFFVSKQKIKFEIFIHIETLHFVSDDDIKKYIP